MSVLLDLALNSEVIRQAPGKSKFSQTCNLLSRYLKEKGNSEDLNLRVQSCSSVKNNVTMLPDLNLDLNTSEAEPDHQMTVFYRGKVIVFDKFSEEKVEEIMKLATKSNISSTGSSVSTPNSFQEPQQPQLPPPPPPPPSSDVVGSHIPMARKASLHRFLDKRKGRILTQAPYQLNNSLALRTKPAETNKTWLRSSSESVTLDLQL